MDIRKLRAVLGDKLSQALIALHAFTGCDTVSAFAGRGKTGPLKQLKKDEVCICAAWNILERGSIANKQTAGVHVSHVCCFFKNMQSEHSPT